MGFIPGGIGGTAQRIIRQETPKTELDLPIKLAVVGALSCQVGIAAVMSLALALRAFTLPVLALVFGLAVWAWMRYSGGQHADLRGASFTLLCVMFGAAFAEPFWSHFADGAEALWWFVRLFVDPVARWPPWVFLGLWALWAFAAVKQRGKLAAGIIASALALICVLWSGPAWVHLDEAWNRLRYLLIPLALPVPAFAAVLAVHNWIEALIGAPWPPQFNKVDIAKTGILGLVFPGLLLREREETRVDVVEPMQLTITSGENPVQRMSRIPRPRKNPDGLYEFARSIGVGTATFSEKGSKRSGKQGATHHGYTQVEWWKLRDAFRDAGLGEQRSTGRVVLTDAGLAYLAGLVMRAYGATAVPAKWSRFI